MSNNSHGLFGVSSPVACHCGLALRNDRSYIGSTTRSAQFVPGHHPRRPDIYGRIRVRIRLVPARQT